MADVKFMNLSENDNPASTDSVLIGNSTDGLKRTTVGAIGDLFAVKGLLHFETLQGQTPTTGTTNCATLSAPNVSGYTFAFWLNPSTFGVIVPNGIDNPSSQNANLWFDAKDVATAPIKFSIIAVYFKSTVA